MLVLNLTRDTQLLVMVLQLKSTHSYIRFFYCSNIVVYRFSPPFSIVLLSLLKNGFLLSPTLFWALGRSRTVLKHGNIMDCDIFTGKNYLTDIKENDTLLSEY